jgi:hypothetical protein
MKINSRIENIFAHAVAMDNRGLKNTIHCVGSAVYIVNFDHSMILRFRLRKSEQIFQNPISFNANDYDSSDFDEVDGKIVFNTSEGGYVRKKFCRAADYDPKDIKVLYHKHIKDVDDKYIFYLSRDFCSLLEPELSHIEISVQKGKLLIRQRNVYTGTMIEIQPKDSGFFSENKLPKSFGPVGLKTKDFTSLFSFCDSLAFIPAKEFLLVKDHHKKDFDGILSFCRYDEIINLYHPGGDKIGRKKQKDRASK